MVYACASISILKVLKQLEVNKTNCLLLSYKLRCSNENCIANSRKLTIILVITSMLFKAYHDYWFEFSIWMSKMSNNLNFVKSLSESNFRLFIEVRQYILFNTRKLFWRFFWWNDYRYRGHKILSGGLKFFTKKKTKHFTHQSEYYVS